METSRPVIVKRMPDRLNQKQARMFLRDIQPLLNTDRPQLVFDCLLIRQMDAAGVDMLLHCMAEIMNATASSSWLPFRHKRPSFSSLRGQTGCSRFLKLLVTQFAASIASCPTL